MSDVIDLAVLLTECDVTCEFQHVPSTYDAKSKDWQGICWRVTIKTPRGEFQTDYKEGIGHLPKSWGLTPKSIYESANTEVNAAINETLKSGKRHCPDRNSTYGRPTLYGGRVNFQRVPFPKSESVLACLFCDAQSGEDNFAEFCANCGYDDDSRKAEAVWRACRDTSANLHRLFTGEQFDKLAEALREV